MPPELADLLTLYVLGVAGLVVFIFFLIFGSAH
jgi:hypothetical protein